LLGFGPAKPAVVEIVTTDQKGSTNRLGTGFFISSDAQVVTNQHVVEGAASIAAINNNGAMFLFERVVAQPPGMDLAVLKFRATDVPFLTLGKSTTVVEGQKVIVIGNPTGLTGTVSDGIISAFRENRSLIQITAPISPGSSGSPVMDEKGKVIGVATLQRVEGQNLNFAIPVEKVSVALTQQLPREQSSSPALATATPTPAIDAKVYFDRGMKFLDRKDYDNAISDFTEAIRLDPNLAIAYYKRGWVYGKMKNFDKAISDCNEAIRLDPNYAPAYNIRGVAYAEQGNLDKAMRDFDKAIRLDPRYVPAYDNRGKAYYAKGNHAKANADFAAAKRLEAEQ
jgi:tetratricopeptide (TPR) repeat protein